MNYIVAPPRMAHYMEWSTRVYNVYLKYIAPEDMHIYSIDEVFMDVTHYLRTYRMTPRELAARILGPGPRAEDAVHDAFMKLMQNYGQLCSRSDGQLERWLMVVVKNAALDMLRKEGRETGLENWEPAAAPDQGEFETLVALIRSMPEDYRRVLELKFRRGLFEEPYVPEDGGWRGYKFIRDKKRGYV